MLNASRHEAAQKFVAQQVPTFDVLFKTIPALLALLPVRHLTQHEVPVLVLLSQRPTLVQTFCHVEPPLPRRVGRRHAHEFRVFKRQQRFWAGSRCSCLLVLRAVVELHRKPRGLCGRNGRQLECHGGGKVGQACLFFDRGKLRSPVRYILVVPGLRSILGRRPFAYVEAEMREVVLAVARCSVEARSIARRRQADAVGSIEVHSVVSIRNLGVVCRGLLELIAEPRWRPVRLASDT